MVLTGISSRSVVFSIVFHASSINRISVTILSSHCLGSRRSLLFFVISSDCRLCLTLLPPRRSCIIVSASSRKGQVAIVSSSSYLANITVVSIFFDRSNRCCIRLFLLVVGIISFSSFRIVSTSIPSSRCCGSRITFFHSSNNPWDRRFIVSFWFRCDLLLFIVSKGYFPLSNSPLVFQMIDLSALPRCVELYR